jgi:hypothetical protein
MKDKITEILEKLGYHYYQDQKMWASTGTSDCVYLEYLDNGYFRLSWGSFSIPISPYQNNLETYLKEYLLNNRVW